MSPRRYLAAALLALVVSMAPGLVWLVAHVLRHHDHHDQHAPHGHHAATAHRAACGEVAVALAHGHGHDESVPEHEHDLVPSPPLRHDPSRDLAAPAVAALGVPEGPAPSAPALHAGARARPVGLTGSGPPLLALLCVLLI